MTDLTTSNKTGLFRAQAQPCEVDENCASNICVGETESVDWYYRGRTPWTNFCGRVGPGKHCNIDNDCESNICTGATSTCGPHPTFSECAKDWDCESQNCVRGVCGYATETTRAVQRTIDGGACTWNTDCQGGICVKDGIGVNDTGKGTCGRKVSMETCSTDNECNSNTCAGVQWPNVTGNCAPVLKGTKCYYDRDCSDDMTSFCDFADNTGRCDYTRAEDGTMTPDCSHKYAGVCNTREDGHLWCKSGSDCASNECRGGLCTCVGDFQCLSNACHDEFCTEGNRGDYCEYNEQCKSLDCGSTDNTCTKGFNFRDGCATKGCEELYNYNEECFGWLTNAPDGLNDLCYDYDVEFAPYSCVRNYSCSIGGGASGFSNTDAAKQATTTSLCANACSATTDCLAWEFGRTSLDGEFQCTLFTSLETSPDQGGDGSSCSLSYFGSTVGVSVNYLNFSGGIDKKYFTTDQCL